MAVVVVVIPESNDDIDVEDAVAAGMEDRRWDAVGCSTLQMFFGVIFQLPMLRPLDDIVVVVRPGGGGTAKDTSMPRSSSSPSTPPSASLSRSLALKLVNLPSWSSTVHDDDGSKYGSSTTFATTTAQLLMVLVRLLSSFPSNLEKDNDGAIEGVNSDAVARVIRCCLSLVVCSRRRCCWRWCYGRDQKEQRFYFGIACCVVFFSACPTADRSSFIQRLIEDSIRASKPDFDLCGFRTLPAAIRSGE